MTKICIYATRFAETQIFNDMKNKLFILGWDNALVSDIVENKVHPAYLAMLAEVDPNLHARWTLDDTVSMQGEQPEKIWQSFCELLGDEKGRRAREIFYQTYRRLPLPPLTENALPFLRKLNACGCVVAVVSNKTQKILEEEIRMRKLDGLIDIAIDTAEKEEPRGTVGGYDRRFNSRGFGTGVRLDCRRACGACVCVRTVRFRLYDRFGLEGRSALMLSVNVLRPGVCRAFFAAVKDGTVRL